MSIKSLIPALVILCVIIACKKNSTEGNSIVGKWKLKETLMDPGDGSGTWRSVAIYGVATELHLEFFADSTMHGNASFFSYYDRYYTTPDSKIYMIKSALHDTTQMRYSIESGKLTINPQCFEACGFRFTRSY